MGGRRYAPHKSGSTILCAAKADRARRWGGSPHTHSCEAEPAGRVEPSGRGGGGPGKPRAAVRGDMWRGHGGGDGAVLGARSAHFSAEKGLMSGICGPSSSRTVDHQLGVGRGDLGSARIARVHAFLLSTHPLTCLEHTGSATTHKNNGQPDVRSRKISIFSRQRPREP